MGGGATSLSNHPRRRKTDIVGEHLPDPFFDSYEQEGFACSDILRVADDCETELVTIVISKVFLKKLVRSQLWWIKEMEKFKVCPQK